MNNNKTLENMLWIFIPNIAKIISNRKGISLKKANEFMIFCIEISKKKINLQEKKYMNYLKNMEY